MRLEVEELEQRKNIDRLVRDLNNDDVHVRRRSAEALGKFADVASVKPLIECLSDSDKDVGGPPLHSESSLMLVFTILLL